MVRHTREVDQSYRQAQERYARIGVDTDRALQALARIPISIHCWQGDDVGGFEADRDFTARLALLEEAKSMPFGAVWDFHCLTAGVPVADAWLSDVRRYETEVLSQR